MTDVRMLLPVAILVGLSLFLFGMSQLEIGIRALGYATFKRWLLRSTGSALGGVSVGIGVTAILQSSSMVSLLVLAFASAGLLPLINAVSVLLGANLGTTISGWMVATVGFKLSLHLFALPMMGGGALLQLIAAKRERARAAGTLLFGFGLLVFGLEIMKSAVEEVAVRWDLGALRGHGAWLYFLAGAALAAIIQSSSATMMMTLAALHGGLIDLPSAAAIVIGADLGTTSTTALGSIGGHRIKRQLALAHVVFNVAVDLGAFFLLLPLLPRLLAVLQLSDPLFGLVAFHSLFNLVGLALFVPILKPYSAWIGSRFSSDARERPSLLEMPVDVPDAALVATDKVVREIRANAVVLSLEIFDSSTGDLTLPPAVADELAAADDSGASVEERYQAIKHLESELLAFTMDLQAQPLSATQVARLARQGIQARSVVYGCKTLKDIRHNLPDLRDSTHEPISGLYQQHRDYLRQFYERYLALLAHDGGTEENMTRDFVDDEGRVSLISGNEAHLQACNDRVRAIAASDVISGSELSNMLNVNREIHHAIKTLLSFS